MVAYKDSVDGCLYIAASRPLRRFCLQAGDADDRNYRLLTDLVRAIVGEAAWKRDANTAVRKTIQQAICQLDEFFPQSGAGVSGRPKRDAAMILFGFADEKLTPRPGFEHAPFEYDEDYYPAAKQLIGEHHVGAVFDRITRGMRRDIAKILVSMAERASLIRADETDGSAPQLVERSEIESLLDLIEAGRRVIGIWGEPGTGKSTLARQVAERYAPDRTIVLRLGNDRVLEDDIVEALIREGMNPENWSSSYCRVKLRQVLSASPRSRLIIIDNLTEDDDFDRLIQPDVVIPVLVKARRRPGIKGVSRELDDLSDELACLFIERAVVCDRAQSAALAHALGNRALALDLAVRYLKECPAVGIAELTRFVLTSTNSGINLVTPLERDADHLVRLYQMTTQLLRQNSDSAWKTLMRFIAITGRSGIAQYDLVQTFTKSSYGGSMEAVEFAAAIRTLCQYGLLRADRSRLLMHQLTYEILRESAGKLVFALENRVLAFLMSKEEMPQEEGSTKLIVRAERSRLATCQ